MDHIVRQILIEIREGVRIGTELLVLCAKAVTCSDHAEALKIDNVECTDVVGTPLQVRLPVALKTTKKQKYNN